MRIGILIPTTSNGRNWTDYRETYLYSTTLRTFLKTYNDEHTYIFYIGIDENDKIMDNNETKKSINELKQTYKNIDFKFIYMTGINKGHLTAMWNRLFKIGLTDNCDYFFQCGDDIYFKTKNWINDCINTLEEHNNIGLTGPSNNNYLILTQSFVSREHYKLFGYFFPEEIINWYCDDWINKVYKGLNSYFPLKNHYCANIGGNPRYSIHNIANKNVSNGVFNVYNYDANDIDKKMANTLNNCIYRDINKAKQRIGL